MLVGVDFDNTIVCYDQVFHRVALEQGLIPAEVPITKAGVRDYLRRCGNEDAWTELQGYVYGACMHDTLPFPGVLEFFARCKGHGISVCIISHKTRHPFQGPNYDLHQVAQEWLESHGFYDPSLIGLGPHQVYFELTKREKLDRIAKVDCSHFIDDLPEFLTEPGFPAGVERILFDPNSHHPIGGDFYYATSWAEIDQLIIGQKVPA
ncbi:MAG: haloacid dehalogenase-like hydrolase [Deltaproteobacteria bacterium]|nr:MAG: haloacid dehalogenase-like hydrolase [Deltaproteobacteria bacterium]